jgi:ferrous iron transport protein B
MNAEMESPKWLWGAIAFQLGMGYVLSFLVYQLGTLFTTGSVGAGFLGGLIAALVMVGYVVILIRRSSTRVMRPVAEEVA